MSNKSTSKPSCLKELKDKLGSEFATRHIGPNLAEIESMLEELNISSLDQLIEQTVPTSIRSHRALALRPAVSEPEALAELRVIAKKNQVRRSFIGLGYYGCFTPGVVQRNILENPGWYTQYTPYQPEISQGRLEALLNFQTLICDLTGMEVSNASVLDEGTAAAEAMTACARIQVKLNPGANKFFVSRGVFPQTIDVLKTRAEPLGIELVFGCAMETKLDSSYFGAIVQYPDQKGRITDLGGFISSAHSNKVMVIVAADLLSLTLLTPPGKWGADFVVGSAQRFGVPFGFGGPHAGFMSCKDEHKREMPGRMIGVSRDVHGKPALRLALQTREQHIRRERATSNICTAQVLLAVMASMYAVYHGPRGLREIARRTNGLACVLSNKLRNSGFKTVSDSFFDTVVVTDIDKQKSEILSRAVEKGLNLRVDLDNCLGVSFDETHSVSDLCDLVWVFTGKSVSIQELQSQLEKTESSIPQSLSRGEDFLEHEVFNSYRSETEMLRYIRRLERKDLSLTTSMIPLGSCTMKLNATTEMFPVTWPEFGQIHPFAPSEQTTGYKALIEDLEGMLAEVTGFHAVSLQPNAGSQGEYAGLLAIRGYMKSKGQADRNVCLIPSSAHGTNPATAAMCGMEVVIIKSNDQGDVDFDDLKAKAEQYKDRLAALMITYPSTHGVFEENIRSICETIHQFGGQVYMDGANMNAQVGVCRPGDFGVDVCHLNLHKTFCIPHGGGGPGVGPIGVAKHLAPFLPGHVLADCNEGRKSGRENESYGAVSSAPWGSASILVIPWVYIRLMGPAGLKSATELAILNANYIAARLEPHFPVVYRGKNGFVAHECILDLRGLKHAVGIEAADVAKRLMDFGFHAPTVSFPVAETLMVEPTESESKAELDRFCDAMIAIREEIRAVENGKVSKTDNLLKNAPHSADAVTAEQWNHPYSRSEAAYPLPWVRDNKFWPAVGRIDGAFGDRNFCCTCS